MTQTSTQSFHNSEIVISFFEILQLMLKSPGSRRMIDWRMKFFERDVFSVDQNSPLWRPALRMVEELELCRRRKRSRFRMYNVSDIDAVSTQYYICKSPVTLGNAWSLFETENYRIH